MKLKIYTTGISFCFLLLTKNAVSQMDLLLGAKTICAGSEILLSESVYVFDPMKDSGVWNVATLQRDLEENDPELEKIIAKRKKLMAQNPGTDVGIDLNSSYKTNVASTAYIESSFAGCTYDGGSPSDNTVAVSKAGFVVASANSSVNFYDKSNNRIKTYTLPAFAKDPTTFSYDPKVLYDWVYDRFILVFLEGKTASTSKIVICFSTSGDPTGKWFVYHLNGNANNQGVWFDFPNIGISENDLFVCGNKFTDAGASRGSVIFQIVKMNGYKGGGSLKYKIYDTLETQFQDPLFSLYPASHGQALIGPGMYFVNSIKNGGSEIDISQITDSLNSGKAVFKVSQYNTNFNYNVPFSTLMKGAPNQKQLSNNDCRILGALTLKNYIFFCFHADIGTKGYSSLILCRFNTKTGAIDSSTLSGYQTSFGFPNIASIGFGDWDHTLVMTFLASSNKMYPSCYYTTIEQNLSWAQPTLIKSGDWYYNSQGTQNDERWGDYTGVCRWNGNFCPAAVTHTSFAQKNVSTPNVTLGDYANWTTRLLYCNPNDIEKPVEPAFNTTLYPNPVNLEYAHLDFSIKHREKIKIDVYNTEGKWLKTLSNDILPEGKYSFMIETSSLPNGIYYIHIVNGKMQNLNTQKLVVVR